MVILNIFQNSDGSLALDNLLILLVAFLLGFLFNRFTGNQRQNKLMAKGIAEWENKFRKLENEFKAYKANIGASEKKDEKALHEMSQRVKSLEGDIRALAEEKSKYAHQAAAQAEEIKKYSRQLTELEENLKSVQETGAKAEADWKARLHASGEALQKASAWEGRVRAAEEEALKARAALNLAERRKLEAELRLKSTAEYAGKVVPLEQDLAAARDKLQAAEQELNALKREKMQQDELLAALRKNQSGTEDLAGRIRTLEAQLALQKETNTILRQEIEIKQASNLALQSEMENLRLAIPLPGQTDHSPDTAAEAKAIAESAD